MGEEGKRWYNSKTILLNMVVGLALAIVPAVPGAESLAGWVNGNASVIGAIWSGLNIVLRFVTKERVKLFD